MIAGVFLIAAMILLAAWVSVPAAGILPGSGDMGVALGRPVEIDASPLASITKFAVYADGQLLGMEYNLGSGSLARDFDLKPGQQVRIETKVTSILGITREFVSTFTTVTPIALQSIAANGVRLVPGQKIPPQPTLTFEFNKPVSQASISLDGSGPIDLQVDPSRQTEAVLPPTVSFRQGAVHILKLTATGMDSSETPQPVEVRVPVIKPLTFYGKTSEANGVTTVELDSSVAFRDPELVKKTITTTIPDANISVEKQKIILLAPGLDRLSSYNILVNSAEGLDGSFLEQPLSLTVAFQGGQTQTDTGGSGYAVRGYVYSEGGSTQLASQPAAAEAPAAAGPPPGWPPCCPWPPE